MAELGSRVPLEARVPEEQFKFFIGVAAEGRSDKVRRGKPNRAEEGICRGGDDCSFFQRFAPNQHEVLISGMVLDGVSEGGLGHEAAFSAAKRVRRLLTHLFLRPREKGYILNEVAGTVLAKIQAVNKGIRFERKQKLERIKKEKKSSDEDTYAATGALFLVQKGYDSKTGRQCLYLHTWSIGDSFVGVGVKIGERPYEVYRLNIPHNIPGALTKAELGIGTMSPGVLAGLTIGEQKRVLERKEREIDETYKSGILGAFGFDDKLGEEKIDYQRIILPTGSKIQKLDIVAMSDGVWGTADSQRITKVLESSQGNKAAMGLTALGKELDLDDCCAVVASLKAS